MEGLAVLSLQLAKFREQRKMASWAGSWEGKGYSPQKQHSSVTLQASISICLWVYLADLELMP